MLSMIIFGQPVSYWLALIGAAAMRVLLSPWEGAVKALISLASALFFGTTFSPPLISYLHVTDDSGKIVVVVLVAMTGENIARGVLYMISSPDKVSSLLTTFILRTPPKDDKK